MFYNPAGLVDDSHTDISLSASLYGYQQSSQGAANFSPTPPLTDLNATVANLVVIPSASGAVHTFEAGKDGGYLNAISAGLFLPEFQTSDNTYSTANAAGSKTYRSTVSDRTLMPGIGYARRIGDFRVGISTFYVLRLLSSDQTSSVTNTSGAFRVGDVSSSLIAGNLRWTIGGKWQASQRLSLGLALTLPDVGINSSGSVRYRQGIADPAFGAPTFTQIELENLRSSWHEPTVIKAGSALHLFSGLLLSLDITFYLPVSYDLLRVNDAQAAAAVPFVLHVDRHAVANLNAGAEWYLYKNIFLGGGFFTDFSSSADLSGAAFEGTLGQQYLPSIDNYGFSATVGWDAKHTTTRLGVMYSAGTGYDVVAQDDVLRLSQNAHSYERARVFNSFFYIFISSTLKL